MEKSILIADDDWDNRRIAMDVLEAAHYRVLEATDGLQALKIALEERPHLILLDLSMPKLSGWEVAKRLREAPQMNQTPMIAFTAHAIMGDQLKAKTAGCDDYLSKPCLPTALLKKVKGWLKPVPEKIHDQNSCYRR